MSRVACLALVCGLAVHANASPRSDPTTGRAVFTGATEPSATSLDLDPAALALVSSSEFYAAATAVVDHYGIARDTTDPATGAAVGPGATLHDNELGPGGNLAVLIHSEHIPTVGFSLRAAPAEVFPQGLTPLQYQTLGGSHRTFAATFAGGGKITNSVLFGIGLSYQTTYLHLHYARDTALEAGNGPGGITSDCGGSPCGVENPLATERYDVRVRSDPVLDRERRDQCGAFMVELAKDMWLAVAYHTPPGLSIDTTLVGEMTIVRAPRDGGNTLHGGSTVNLSEPASADAEFRARLAQQLDLHVGFRWEDLSRFEAYDVRAYGSTFPNANIPEWTLRPRGLHDPFSLWAGVEQVDTGETWRFGGRLGVETSSVDDNQTSAITIAPTSFTADVGIQLRIRRSPVVLQLSYGVQYFPTVNVTDSAFSPGDRIACIASGFDYSTPECAATRNGYGIPTADGTYSRVEQSMRFGVRYELP